METNEVVSIIIPIYNVEAYLRQCLETVIHQTYPHLEIILVNDGSPDQSEEICKEFFRKDARIRYVRQENGGLSAARNTGIELATGDYITFIDPDDWVTEDYVEVLYRQLKKYDADVSVANYCLLYTSGVMDGETQEKPVVWQPQDALYRTMFKQEELVEFVRAASSSEEEFDRSVAALHEALDKAADKVRSKHPAEISMVGQVDALIDTLYLTYGSFVLMGVDPEEVFEIVHRANMGKIFPDGRAHFDPVTHKILKPDDWEEKYAPEPAIQKELDRQLKAYEKHAKQKEAKKDN